MIDRLWANRGRTEVDEDEDDDADGMSYRTLGVAVPRTIQQRLIVGECMNTPVNQYDDVPFQTTARCVHDKRCC